MPKSTGMNCAPCCGRCCTAAAAIAPSMPVPFMIPVNAPAAKNAGHENGRRSVGGDARLLRLQIGEIQHQCKHRPQHEDHHRICLSGQHSTEYENRERQIREKEPRQGGSLSQRLQDFCVHACGWAFLQSTFFAHAEPPRDEKHKCQSDYLTPTMGKKMVAAEICKAAEARIVGPVHGRKFTPAAIQTTHARMRRSMPTFS